MPGSSITIGNLCRGALYAIECYGVVGAPHREQPSQPIRFYERSVEFSGAKDLDLDSRDRVSSKQITRDIAGGRYGATRACVCLASPLTAKQPLGFLHTDHEPEPGK